MIVMQEKFLGNKIIMSYVPHFEVTPYSIRRKEALTWLLCWKNSPKIRAFINKDVAVYIAKFVYGDFDFCMTLADQRGGEYQMEWLNLGLLGSEETTWLILNWDNSDCFITPCPRCLLPTQRVHVKTRDSIGKIQCEIHGIFDHFVLDRSKVNSLGSRFRFPPLIQN